MNLEPSSKGIVRRAFHKAKFGQDKFILVQTNRVHYIEAGEGEPLVMIPGSYSTRRTWANLIPLLAKENRILVLDFEMSSVQDPTDLVTKIVQQMNLGKVVLMGSSQSGKTIFELAVHHPELVNKIVSLGGGVFQPEPNSKNISRKSWYKLTLTHKPSDNIEEVKSIKSPVLYLYGMQSGSQEILSEKNIKFLETYLPQTWIVALEGRIRYIAMHQPAEITDIIREFLRKKPAR